MDTFFRIKTEIVDPLQEQIMNIFSGPYVSQNEATIVMMECKTIILAPWIPNPKIFSTYSLMRFTVQECMMIDQHIEVINERLTEECSYSIYTGGVL